jgi:hypothetical protein
MEVQISVYSPSYTHFLPTSKKNPRKESVSSNYLFPHQAIHTLEKLKRERDGTARA